MKKRFELSVKDILEKEFHIDLKGYCADEVDQFLDVVIRDYESYEETIQNLGESLHRFEEENQKLKQRIRDLEVSLEGKRVEDSVSVDHLDIIKRLSRLEKAVFQNK